MELLNFYLIISTVVSFYSCISGLSCLTCSDCEEEIKARETCRGSKAYCISYVGVSGKIVKRCGTHEECKRVMNPSPDHSQFVESQKSFVDGLIEFDIAAMADTTFNQNDSYCCNTDLCNSQSVSMLKQLSSVFTKAPMGDVHEAMHRDGNSEGFAGGEIINIGNSLKEYFDDVITHPHVRRQTGYNAPKLRSSTLSVNTNSFSEKRAIKRSPDGMESTVKNPDLRKDEVIVSVSRDETTLLASVITTTSARPTVAFDNSTVTDSSDKGNAEPVNKGIRLKNYGEYILVPFFLLYIFW